MNNSLIIAQNAISTYNNLFSLNDLHKVKGCKFATLKNSKKHLTNKND